MSKGYLTSGEQQLISELGGVHQTLAAWARDLIDQGASVSTVRYELAQLVERSRRDIPTNLDKGAA
jgi:recombinational DNA repair ATPase RecF